MQLKNFNFMFFVVLICLSLSFLHGAWSFKQAKVIILENQDYEYISQKQERDFNQWDLDRRFNLNLIVGIFFFMITLTYLLISLDWHKNTQTPKKVKK